MKMLHIKRIIKLKKKYIILERNPGKMPFQIVVTLLISVMSGKCKEGCLVYTFGGWNILLICQNLGHINGSNTSIPLVKVCYRNLCIQAYLIQHCNSVHCYLSVHKVFKRTLHGMS